MRTSSSPVPRRGSLALLTSVMAAAPAVNYAFAAAGPAMLDSGIVTSPEFAALPAVTFVLAAVLGRSCGALSDRLDLSRQVHAVFLLAALSLLVAAGGTNFWWFLAASVIAAPGQALCNSLTNRAVRAVAPHARVPTWIGVKQSGVQAGQFLVGAVMIVAIGSVGWRSGMLVVGAIVLGVVLIGHRRTAELGSTVRPVTGRRPRVSLPRGVALTIGVVGLSGFAMQSLNVFLALFVADGLGYGTAGGAAAVAGIGLTGLAARAGMARGLTRGRSVGSSLVTATALALLVPPGLWLAESSVRWIVWLVVILAGASLLCVSAVANTLVIQTCGSDVIGAVSARLSTWMYVGFASGPVVTGAVLHTTGSFALAWVPSAVAVFGGVVLAVAASTQRRALTC
ncbi:MFS transporter [Curtobacterium sp. B8]|uniref:MFS transporter n=1 Tax=Curtobacterium sp. B8 TaxID=95611 RepID=UPI00034CC4CB|nr:MFS transporter [Curtobacterium sp. B8]